MTAPAPQPEHRHLCGAPAEVAAEIEAMVLDGWSFIDVPHGAAPGIWCLDAYLSAGSRPLRVAS